MIEHGGVDSYGISYMLNGSVVELGNEEHLSINHLGVGSLVIRAGVTITSNPILDIFRQGDLLNMDYTTLQNALVTGKLATLHNLTIYYIGNNGNETISLPESAPIGLKFEFIKGTADTFEITFTSSYGSVVSNRSTTITNPYDRIQLTYVGGGTWVLDGTIEAYSKTEIDTMIGDIESLLGEYNMSIASEILRLQQAKQAIKESINNKGGTLTNESIDNYAQAIDNLPSGGGGMTYQDYARTLYLVRGKSNQFETAWDHSLIVDPLEISEDSVQSSPRGIAQYPNGETEGVIIPEGVTSIGAYAFYGWTSNNQPLVIPDSVKSIGLTVFRDWTSNNQPLVIPDSVKSIGNGSSKCVTSELRSRYGTASK